MWTEFRRVLVRYATANGTATAGSDYVAASGTLTFAPGVATQNVAVVVNGDPTPEPDETFVVTLSSPTNAGLGTAQGTGTIVNDDAAPTPTVTASPTAVAPGGTITIAVANGPGNPNDWAALAPANAPDSTYVAWQYLNGTTTVPATGVTTAMLQFAAPTTADTYTARLFVNAGGWTRAATSNAVTMRGASGRARENVGVTAATSGRKAVGVRVRWSLIWTQTMAVNKETQK